MNAVARHKTAVEFATDEIKSRIISQQFPPGTRIDQTVLADMLGLSRIPVRQALAQLSDRGFVHLQAHRSAIVAPLSKTDMTHLYTLRRQLEVWAAPGIAKSADVQLCETLKEINEQLVAIALYDDLPRYMEVNRQFHFEILGRVDNPHLERMVKILFDLTERYQWMCLNADAYLKRSLDDHRDIVEALENTDESRLADIMLRHNKKTADWCEANIDNY